MIRMNEVAKFLHHHISPEKVFPGTVQKCVYDFFNGKSEAEAQRYIDLCRQMERFGEKSE